LELESESEWVAVDIIVAAAAATVVFVVVAVVTVVAADALARAAAAAAVLLSRALESASSLAPKPSWEMASTRRAAPVSEGWYCTSQRCSISDTVHESTPASLDSALWEQTINKHEQMKEE
jgi:type II secretory pathway pseudopilin PulG